MSRAKEEISGATLSTKSDEQPVLESISLMIFSRVTCDKKSWRGNRWDSMVVFKGICMVSG